MTMAIGPTPAFNRLTEMTNRPSERVKSALARRLKSRIAFEHRIGHLSEALDEHQRSHDPEQVGIARPEEVVDGTGSEVDGNRQHDRHHHVDGERHGHPLGLALLLLEDERGAHADAEEDVDPEDQREGDADHADAVGSEDLRGDGVGGERADLHEREADQRPDEAAGGLATEAEIVVARRPVDRPVGPTLRYVCHQRP
ncbi:MAG: hypothetical protein V9G12_04205 [Microthrixaceae bacterium]